MDKLTLFVLRLIGYDQEEDLERQRRIRQISAKADEVIEQHETTIVGAMEKLPCQRKKASHG